MVDVFISYKREERARCERIHEKLKALGLDVWFDVRLTAGKSFDREIETAVKGAKAVVVLWSPASVESEWVREEAGVGKARGVLAAIRIATCDLPFGFGTTHVEDIHEAEFADDHPAWLKILDRIGELMGRPDLVDYSRTVGHTTSLLHRFAERHPTSPLAGKARLLAERLADSSGEGAVPHGAGTSAAPRPLSGPEAGWAQIEASSDPRDYADFLEVHPQSEQAFEARRRKRKLEDWAGTDQTDPGAVMAFLRSGSFAALQTLVQATADNLAGAAERSRLLSVPPSAKASEARAAAVAKRAVLARSFGINLSGVSNWPRPVMVAIPPGRFTMGLLGTEERSEGYDGEEEPRHDVEIAHVFALGRGAVTLGAFSAFIAETNHDMGESAFVLNGDKWENTPGRGWRDPGFAQGDDHPVTCVSWHDAQAFIAWLNERLALTDRPDAYRLPSEAEWEYACRAGTKTPFSFGASITTDQANFNGTAGYGGAQPSMIWRKATTPVGRFPANAFGIYDMHGDAWEWCEDAWNKTYDGAPADGAPWRTGDAALRVLRGGSWYDPPQVCHSAVRDRYNPTVRGSFCGFRLARTLSPPAS